MITLPTPTQNHNPFRLLHFLIISKLLKYKYIYIQIYIFHNF